MSFDRALLGFLAAFVLVAGVGCLVLPASLAEQVGFAVAPGSLTEIRAFYGGLQIGLGCFLFWCLRDEALTFAALLLEGIAVGGVGAGRALGMLVDHSATAYHLANLAVEVTTVVLVAVAFSRRRAGGRAV